MSSSYEANNQVETIYSPRIQSGIFAAIGAFVSPVIIPLVHLISLGFNPSSTTTAILLIATVLIVAIFWASAIVSCVWDMIRYGSHASAAGLFILLLAPILWLLIGGFLLASKVAEYLAELESVIPLG